MYSLVYESNMIKTLTDLEFQELMHTSYLNNSIHDITGILVLYKHKFVQIIEGESSTIKSLYSKINVDKRHHKIRLLAEGYINKRSFSEWFMAYFNPSISNDNFTTEGELKKYLLDFLSKDTLSNKVAIMFYLKITEMFKNLDEV